MTLAIACALVFALAIPIFAFTECCRHCRHSRHNRSETPVAREAERRRMQARSDDPRGGVFR